MGDKTYVPRWGKGVSPMEWRERLMTLNSPAREAAARIIWWEFLSLQLVGERCDVLDDLLAYTPAVTDAELQDALVAIGMPRAVAQRRITTPKPRPPRRRVRP